jgi:hypothetical protein
LTATRYRVISTPALTADNVLDQGAPHLVNCAIVCLRVVLGHGERYVVDSGNAKTLKSHFTTSLLVWHRLARRGQNPADLQEVALSGLAELGQGVRPRNALVLSLHLLEPIEAFYC